MKLLTLFAMFLTGCAAQISQHSIRVTPTPTRTVVGWIDFVDKQTTPHRLRFEGPDSIASDILYKFDGTTTNGCLQGIFSGATYNITTAACSGVANGFTVTNDSNVPGGIGTSITGLSAFYSSAGGGGGGWVMSPTAGSSFNTYMVSAYSGGNPYVAFHAPGATLRLNQLGTNVEVGDLVFLSGIMRSSGVVMTVQGSASVNGNILLQPQNVVGNASVVIESPRLDRPGLIIRPAAGTTTGNTIEIQNNAGTVTHFKIIGPTDAGCPACVVMGSIYGNTANTQEIGSAANPWLKAWLTNLNVAGTATVLDLSVSGTCTGCGATLPISDASALLKDNADPTKLFRFELGGFSTGVTRVATPPNSNFTIAALDVVQTFTSGKTFTALLDIQAGAIISSTTGLTMSSGADVVFSASGNDASFQSGAKAIFQSGSILQLDSGSSHTISVDWVPAANNTYKLGTGVKWLEGNITTVNATTVNAIVAAITAAASSQALTITGNRTSEIITFSNSGAGSVMSATTTASGVGAIAALNNHASGYGFVDGSAFGSLFTNLRMSGTVLKYNNVDTQGYGLNPVYYSANGTGLTTSQSINLTVNGGIAPAGFYRISATLGCTAINLDTGQFITPFLTWDDGPGGLTASMLPTVKDSTDFILNCGTGATNAGHSKSLIASVYTDGNQHIEFGPSVGSPGTLTAGASYYYRVILERLQ